MKFVTFDLTNTLFKVSKSVGYQYSKIARNFNYDLDADLVNRNFRKHFKQLNKSFPGYGIHAGITSRDWWNRLACGVIKDNVDEFNRPASSNMMVRIANEIFDQFDKESYWQKYEKSDYLLDQLKSKHHFRMGVISNFDERLFRLIQNVNWAKYFEFVQIPITSDGHYKPNKEIFDKAKQNWPELGSARPIHVGDDYNLDYKAAKSAAYDAILIKHGWNRSKISKEIDDSQFDPNDCVFDLDQLLAKLVSK